MNFIDRLFGRQPERRASLSDPDEELRAIFGVSNGIAGFDVSGNGALRSPTALAATRAISETVGMLPIAVRRRDGEVSERDREHPAAKLLSGFVNPWTAGTDLRTAMQVDAILHKGAFAQVVRVQGEPRELHRLPPHAVTVEFDDLTGEPRYKIQRKAGGTVTLSYRDVLHIQSPGSTPERSMAPVALAKEAIALDILMARHQSKTFGPGGGLPRLLLSPDSTQVSQEAIQKAIQFIQRQTGDDSSKPVVLPAAFKDAIKSFGLSDMSFVELRRLVIEDIARAMRVPSQLIGDLTKSTFNNVESQSRNFLVYSLLPWLETWEAALTRTLIDPADRETVELEFITEDLLRGDTATRFRAYREAGGGAWLLRNEIRRLEGRAPVEGGDELLNQAGQTGATGQDDEDPQT